MIRQRKSFEVGCNARRTVLVMGALAALCTTSVRADDGGMADLLQRCAPGVGMVTMSSIIKVESHGHAFALADAGPVNLPWSVRKNLVRSFFPGSVAEAAQLARDLIARGHTVSLGLAQVNDRNLARMGLTIEQVLDPCTNVATGARILTDFYGRAVQVYGPGERALRAAISAYNSGDFERGESNGYVGLVYSAAGAVPSLSTSPVRSGAGKSSKGGGGGSPAQRWWNSRAAMLREARESPLQDMKVSSAGSQ